MNQSLEKIYLYYIMPKIIHIRLKHSLHDYDKIHKNYDYPIKSFLNGHGDWTYTDIDHLKEKYGIISGPVPFACHDNGKRCHEARLCQYSNDGDYKCKFGREEDLYHLKPTIPPKDLLDIKT